MHRHDWSKPKRAHVTPLFISLHWLSVAARIKFKTLMLAYRTTTGSAPSYIHSQSTSPQEVWDLRASVASWCHHRETQNHSPERFHSPFLAGGINFHQQKKKCLDICITSTSCVSLPLYNVSLIVFLNCKSLWIKASAKWINVYVMSLAIFFIFYFLLFVYYFLTESLNILQQ